MLDYSGIIHQVLLVFPQKYKGEWYQNTSDDEGTKTPRIVVFTVGFLGNDPCLNLIAERVIDKVIEFIFFVKEAIRNDFRFFFFVKEVKESPVIFFLK